MTNLPFHTLAALRTVIGYLGEQAQFAWWSSAFFAPGSAAFLSPIFGRTQVPAQATGVTRAAALVHDERIGVGRVYHLFRLPEDVEQGIHRIFLDPAISHRIMALVADREAALAYLRTQAGSIAADGIGPTPVGTVHELRRSQPWHTVAAHYVHGFAQQTEVYPYFTDTL
jgi:hypothetical protein